MGIFKWFYPPDAANDPYNQKKPPKKEEAEERLCDDIYGSIEHLSDNELKNSYRLTLYIYSTLKDEFNKRFEKKCPKCDKICIPPLYIDDPFLPFCDKCKHFLKGPKDNIQCIKLNDLERKNNGHD